SRSGIHPGSSPGAARLTTTTTSARMESQPQRKENIMYDAQTGQEIDVDEAWDEMLDAAHEPVIICGIEFLPSQILRDCDPIAYRVYRSDFESERVSDGEWSETDPTED